MAPVSSTDRRINWRPIQHLLAAVPVILLATVLIVQSAVNIPFDHVVSFQAELNILPNIGFIILAVLAAWVMMKTGRSQLVWMGSGVLVLGLAILLANAFGTPFSLNAGVQIQNLGALLAGALHLVGALIALFSTGLVRTGLRQRLIDLTAGYGGGITAVLLIVILARTEVLPEFFIVGEGGTPIRQVVISLAAALFAISALVVFMQYVRSRSPFLYMYGLALAFLSLGQIAYLMTVTRGDIMAWIGRAGQWGASIYLLIGLILVLHLSRSRQANVHQVLDSVFPPSGEGYRFLIEASPDAIIGLDTGGTVLVWNSAAESILGYSSGEAVGRPLEDLIGLRFSGEPEASPGGRRELLFRRRDGREVWLSISVAHGTVRGHPIATVNIIDITGRKQAEEALERRTEDLIRVNREVEAARGEANIYLDILTHDVRNANNVANLYADLLLGCLDGEAAGYAEKLYASIDRSNEILQNVATIRRASEEPGNLAPVDLDAAIREELGSFPDASIRYPGAHAEVLADGLLPTVFNNLIGNAVKFGGPDTEITVRVEEQSDGVLVSVEDTGPGVPDELKERLFSRFGRGMARESGQGLGLFIVRTLVERYGGRVWVEDRIPGHPGEGAVFRFTLVKA
ncbi:PAS domain S-box protein [Methanoculleus sp. Wushi-C6]|uniref:histidine kinase n=1 Tax=Methanoculleus caldifontis TaxID=2651577 RepID=A0ABU3X1C6_9EURY|nr:ATP-binding protein [Methanoculleus sp. Wushi-C6]MDV2481845.1 PAS domain S-box protein [Methanoculleus sp. Wushi-C6]